MADGNPSTGTSNVKLRWFLALLITLLIFAVISPAIVGAFQNLRKQQT